MGVILLLFACHRDDGATEALAIYTRASIDLRGVRPSVAEAQAVVDDPDTLDAAVDALAADDRFGWQVATLFAPVWQTRADESDVAAVDLAMEDEAAYLTSVGEEPLRTVAWIADHDLPWTDVVRAEWTMADATLATRFPVDYPAGGEGWQQVHYTDGRPMAGVLSSSGMWWRYGTTFNNANRGRVNALTRILLCKDYLEQQVAFPPDLDLTDEEALRDAVLTNPSCIACHGALDPISAYLWGFYSEFSNDATDWAYYHADREDNWESFGVAPGYYGQPGGDLDDLGRQIATDHRLPDCLVRRAYEGMLQRPATNADDARLVAHREALLRGGVTLRALFRSLVADPGYRALDGADGTWKLATPDQYAGMVEDLTGWRLSIDGHDAFEVDVYGLRSLAGGGRVSSVNQPVPTPTMVEVQQRIAQGAAGWVTTSGDPDRLVPGADFSLDADDPEAAVLVQALHLRILGQVVATDGYEVITALDLWRALHDGGASSQQAWAGVIEGLLREPAFVVY